MHTVNRRSEWAVVGVELEALPCVGIICQNWSSGGRDVSFWIISPRPRIPLPYHLVYNEF